jgi:hypothetical protein
MFLSGYRFAEDEANFSISTDDPMVTGHELQGDYDLVHYWGLTEAHLIRAVSDIKKILILTEYSARFLPFLPLPHSPFCTVVEYYHNAESLFSFFPSGISLLG